MQEYKDFIDGLVARAESIEARRIQQGWRHTIPPETDQEKDRRTGSMPPPGVYERFARYNRIMDSFTDEQRALLIELVQGEKLAGIQEVLKFLSEHRYQLIADGVSLPLEPFDTELFYDLDARYNKQPWPDERTDVSRGDEDAPSALR